METQQQPQRRLYRSRDILALLGGIHVSSLYRMMDDGRFPKPSKLAGGRTNYWLADQVDTFLASQLKPEAEAA